MSMREKTQADFDLERITQLFDQALTSKDERVVNALRSLLMIVALTDPEASDSKSGPFRQLQEEFTQLQRRLGNLEMEVHQLRNPPERSNPWGGPAGGGSPYTNPGNPYGPIWTTTGTGYNISLQQGSQIKEEEK